MLGRADRHLGSGNATVKALAESRAPGIPDRRVCSAFAMQYGQARPGTAPFGEW